jgi:hypothetical protein
MYEIHLFLGIATAGVENQFGYPFGERHAMLVFSRQPVGTDSDWELAASHLDGSDWTEIEWERATIIDAPSPNTHPTTQAAYDDALAKGSAIIAYSDPVEAER